MYRIWNRQSIPTTETTIKTNPPNQFLWLITMSYTLSLGLMNWWGLALEVKPIPSFFHSTTKICVCRIQCYHHRCMHNRCFRCCQNSNVTACPSYQYIYDSASWTSRVSSTFSMSRWHTTGHFNVYKPVLERRIPRKIMFPQFNFTTISEKITHSQQVGYGIGVVHINLW